MTRNKRTAPDQKERDRIISDLDTTLLVEAGAGSGKTTSLVDRLLALIISGRATIDKVAAVTFTRKAAAELRERFQVALEKKAAEAIPEEEKKRVLDALHRLGEAAIGTIHSFCARMLRERPVEARLDPDFREVDEAEGDQLLERYWQEYLEDAHLSGRAEIKELKRLGIPPEDLIELYKDMSRYRDVTPFEAVQARPKLEPARKALSVLIKRLVPVMPDEEPDGGWDELQMAVKYAQWRIGTYGVVTDPDLVIVLERFDKKIDVTLNRWNDKNSAKEFRDKDLPEFVKDHVQPSLKAWREYVYPYCIRFAKGATQYAAERRAAESLLDFGDLLIKVRDLLRDDEGVRKFFSKRYTRILVDEFQDTDPIQAEILFYLTGESDSPGMGWQERRLRPGSLFVVGDPKQSIYRFRRADIDMYNLVKDLIVKSGGDVLSLSANFRSNDSIGAFVDKGFVDVFPPKADRYQAGFTSLATGRKGPAQYAGACLLSVPGVEKKEDIAEVSSRSVAAWVRWALDGNVQVEGEDRVLRPAKPGDFLVLTMGRSILATVAAALEGQQVPFDLTGAKGFAEAPEVVDAMKLFSCLANPEDSVAVTAVLVSSLFGYSYEELYQFKKSGGHFRFIGAGASSEGKEKSAVHESLAFLEALWEETKNYSPAAAVSVVLERVGLIPLAAASPLGATGAGRLYKLVEMVRIGEGLHVADFASAVKWLQEAMDPEMDRDIEPLSLLLGESDVVRVMNLHKAKGLEASIVILSAPWEFGNHEPKLHVNRIGGEESSGYFLVSKKIGDHASKLIAHPPDWDEKSTEEGRYEDAERIRLLYVAATRARQLLVVTDAPDIKRGENPWNPLKQHVENGLSMEGIDRVGKARPQMTVDGEKGEKHIELVRQAVEAGTAVSVRKEVVTKVAKTGVLLPSAGTAGKGPVWGEIIHRCLQAVAKGETLTKPLVESIMSEWDWPLKEADEAIVLIDRVRKSDLWKRVEESKERHTEVPFAMAIDGKEIGQAEGNCLLDGVIDLVFRENGKWVIVDYKTDRVVGDLEPYMNYYSPQVKLYAKAWEKLSKEEVGAAYLYFVGPGEPMPVGLS